MLDAVAGLISLATKRAFNCRRQLKLGDLLILHEEMLPNIWLCFITKILLYACLKEFKCLATTTDTDE